LLKAATGIAGLDEVTDGGLPRGRIATGVRGLDGMLGGGGYYRGSSVLLSGTPGSGKTSLSARFLEAGCERGERGMLFAFEESTAQIVRNMRSVGVDLQRWVDEGLLRIIAARPAAHGLETHLARIYRAVEQFEPSNVVIDPLSSLQGEEYEINATLSRLIDYFKRRGITSSDVNGSSSRTARRSPPPAAARGIPRTDKER
jgi:circadian clock protein KaiC